MGRIGRVMVHHRRKHRTGAQLAKEDASRLLSLAPTKNFRLAREGEGSGDNREVEYVIYAQLTDFSQLSNAASMEEHEQWEIKVPRTEANAADGKVRVRRTQVKGGNPVYTLTTKTKIKSDTEGASAAIEIDLPSTEENFLQFKFLSDSGMLKHRYHFPILGSELVWEVDVFPNGEGGYHQWVKIDLEVKDPQTQLPELPMNFKEVIMPKGFGEDGGENREERIQAIYSQCFILTNQYLKKLASAETTPSETKEEPHPEDKTPATPAETPPSE